MPPPWCGLAALILVGAACGGGVQTGRPDATGSGGLDGGGDRLAGTVLPYRPRDLDILFLIDDSASMQLAQNRLLNAFPTFMTRLQEPPGLPNVHIAVVSSDMGAGDGSAASCDANGGKKGIFQYTGNVIPPATTPCATSLQAGATYISNVGGVANYSGNLESVFACIAALGGAGCGFEHQFAAILRALGADGREAPAENQGFLRPQAALAIVMLTNEDDCSGVPGSKLYDAASADLASALGPFADYRCNEYGHICDGAAPARRTPLDLTSTVTYAHCESNETGEFLLRVRDTADRLKALKADPSQVVFVSIQGSATPYTVGWRNPSPPDPTCGGGPSCVWPRIEHSCVAPDGSYADPGVRTAQLADEFGDHGVVLQFCVDNFGSNLDQAAQLINRLVGPPCIGGRIAQKADMQADCKVTAHHRNASGVNVDEIVPSCLDSGGADPCWQLQVGGPTCAGATLDVRPDPALTPSADDSVSYDCKPCPSVDALDCI